jgi:hypothetical protein
MKCAFVIVAGLTMAQFAFTQDQPRVAARFFKIPANTTIRVRTISEISSETAHVGDDVQMEVLGDVTVNGYVVIRQGASAIGRISRVKEARSMGRRGNVGLTLSYVEAVTGEHVLASGSRTEKAKGKAGEMATEVIVTTAALGSRVAALWLFENGEESTIPPGTAFSVYTVEDTMIDLSNLTPTGSPPAPPASGAIALPRPTSNSSMTVPSLGVVVGTRVNVGAEIMGIVRDSLAEKAGLHVGDVINAVDRKPVRTALELATELGSRAPASEVRLGYVIRSTIRSSSGTFNYYPKETVVILAEKH